jgi:hypothetical protein
VGGSSSSSRAPPPPPPQAQSEVVVNQEGSLDELIPGASEENVEPGQEIQSQDKEDLQLIVPDNSDEMPSWVQPFDSQQLRDLLKVAMQSAQGSTWWLAKPIAASVFSLEGSSSHHQVPADPRVANSQALVIAPAKQIITKADSQALVIAPAKQIITKVYTRHRFKRKDAKEVTSPLKSQASPPKSLVFPVTAPDYEAKDNKKATNTTARKRKPTPASETTLRRSKKKNKAQNDGYKPT